MYIYTISFCKNTYENISKSFMLTKVHYSHFSSSFEMMSHFVSQPLAHAVLKDTAIFLVPSTAKQRLQQSYCYVSYIFWLIRLTSGLHYYNIITHIRNNIPHPTRGDVTACFQMRRKLFSVQKRFEGVSCRDSCERQLL